MLPTCTAQTFCGFLLAGLGAAIDWGFGNFTVVMVTRALVGAF